MRKLSITLSTYNGEQKWRQNATLPDST